MPVDERPVWMEEPGPLMKMVKALTLVLIVIVMLFPMVYVLSMSFSSAADVARQGLVLFPQNPTLEAYRDILGGGVVQRALQVSVLLTLFGTAAQMFFTATMAYGLSRTTVIGSKTVLYLVLGAMIFSPGMIPSYLLVKELGLLNSYAALVLPGLISAWNLIIVRNFFMNIPQRADGRRAGRRRQRRRRSSTSIVLPLSKAVLAVIALFYGVGLWNLFFNAHALPAGTGQMADPAGAAPVRADGVCNVAAPKPWTPTPCRRQRRRSRWQSWWLPPCRSCSSTRSCRSTSPRVS